MDIDNQQLESSLQNQIIAGLLCSLGALSFGAAMGWSSPAFFELRKLKEITDDELAWAGGLLPLGCLVSLPIFGYIVRNKGRKPAAYIIGIPLIVGLIFKSFSNNPYCILIGRFLCGLGGGGALSLPPLYVNETSEPRARGLLSSVMMAEYSVGVLITYCLGAIIPDIHMLSLTLLPFPLIFLIGFWFMPETPIFRLRLGQEEEAARALAWLRKLPLNSTEIKTELTQMATRMGLTLPLPPKSTQLYYKGRYKPRSHSYWRSPRQIESRRRSFTAEMEKIKARQIIRQSSNTNPKISPWKLLLKTKVGRRGLTLCLALVTSQTFMGILAISTYAAEIFKMAESALEPNTCAILYALVILVGSVLGSLLMDKVGRRILQITSCIIICLCQVLLGGFLWTVEKDFNVKWLNWLPLITLPLCVFSFNMGAGVMPFVIVSEVFSPEVQDIATNLVMMYVWITCFILLQFFPICVFHLGLHVVFFGFAVVSFLSIIYSYFFLIETKGKSGEEILKTLSRENQENDIEDSKTSHELKTIVVDNKTEDKN